MLLLALLGIFTIPALAAGGKKTDEDDVDLNKVVEDTYKVSATSSLSIFSCCFHNSRARPTRRDHLEQKRNGRSWGKGADLFLFFFQHHRDFHKFQEEARLSF